MLISAAPDSNSLASFDYALIRIVPRVDRQEFINGGVLVFCLEKRYLDARIHLAEQRLRALWPEIDVKMVRQHLEAVVRICAGDPDAGPIAKLPQRERWHWLVSARSTILQPSPVHSGLCKSADEVLDRLERELLGPWKTRLPKNLPVVP